MLGHLIDHFVFTSRRLSEKTKWIAFGGLAFTIVVCFWWWKGVAFGIDGPIKEHWGLLWRKVRLVSSHPVLELVLSVLADAASFLQSWNIYEP